MQKRSLHRQPFIPRDKPRSWVIWALALLCGLLVAAPLALIGYFTGITQLANFAKGLFFLSWIVFAVMLLFYNVRKSGGAYDGMEDRN